MKTRSFEINKKQINHCMGDLCCTIVVHPGDYCMKCYNTFNSKELAQREIERLQNQFKSIEELIRRY